MSPIPFPTGIARHMARVRILAADLARLVDDLDHHVVISPCAHARIGNLAHEAQMQADQVSNALAALFTTASARMCEAQDRSYAVDTGEELSSIVRKLAFDLTDGGAA